jgi:transcriptional regulator with XRE-family HTH domain
MADHLTEMQIAAGEAHDLLMRWQLIRVRLHNKLTIETVAERLGWSVDDVIEIESVTADPTLSELRRYALAVGALMTRDVVPEIIAEPEGGD